MTATLLQITHQAAAENLNPEKDSRITLAEARRLIAQAESKANDERLD